MIELPRRQFLTGLSSLIAAPAIVRASSLMPVKNLNNLNLKLITNYEITDEFIIENWTFYTVGLKFLPIVL